MTAAYEGLGVRRDDYDHSERALNALGYKFLRAGRKDEAVSVFEWGVAAYPGSANTHDSLGEAYRAAGRLDEARESYRTALKLDPASRSARAALDAMGAGKQPGDSGD
ncbi:tetratricopeptide repeat protein [Stenotrophomonas acidaminiphila]|nr:tetratricopeptide repeat protein [Stenotrophomonas acidaminiphila]